MDLLFSKFTVTFWMRLIAGISLGIFLSVIALNYHSIGIVQEMNLRLQTGPLEAKSRWLTIAHKLAEAEVVRLAFRAMSSADEADNVAKRMPHILASLNTNLAVLEGEAAEAVKSGSAEYLLAFEHTVEAVTEKKQLLTDLVDRRSSLEEFIYGLDNKRIEEGLLEFQVIEMRYLAETRAELANSVQVFLDRFLRDVANNAKADAGTAVVEAYRKTFQDIVVKDILVADRMQKMVKVAEQIGQMVLDSVAEANQQALHATQRAMEKAQSAQMIALLWTGLGVLLAVSFSVLFNRVFQRRIQLTLHGFAVLAAGDLQFRFQTPQGAVNDLFRITEAANSMTTCFSSLLGVVLAKASELNRIAAQLIDGQRHLLAQTEESNTLIATITRKNEEVDGFTRSVSDNALSTQHQATESQAAAKLLSDNISNIAAASEQASANVFTMAAAAEQMTANIAGVHQNLEQTTLSVSQVATAITQLNQSLEQAKKRCEVAESESNRSKEHVSTTRKVIQRLEESTKEISMVAELINNIAEQTNMLALNATIEAAGAGEAGKGFTVVANEVKALARQTAEATKLIAGKIEEIQDNTQDASVSMDAVEKGIQQVGHLNSEILFSVNEQNQASSSITKSIDTVSTAAQAVSVNARELNAAAGEVARAASEAAMGTNEIARSATEVATQSLGVAKNSETTKDLAEEVARNSRAIMSAAEQVKVLGDQMLASMQALQQVANTIAHNTENLKNCSREMEEATQAFKIREEYCGKQAA